MTEAHRQGFRGMRLRAAEKLLSEPLVGVTTDRRPVPGLFELTTTGLPVDTVRAAARAFYRSLGSQRDDVLHPIHSLEWRRWSHRSDTEFRHGLCLETLAANQRRAALELVKASLSPAGYRSVRGVMRLNETAADLTGNFEAYGEWKYWISLFGTPMFEGPWGWQLDGHHLAVNCVVVGDQMVLSPAFVGSEPVCSTSGSSSGTSVLQLEETLALTFMSQLTEAQRATATVSNRPTRDVFALPQQDNLVLPYEGLHCESLTPLQGDALMRLVATYITRLRNDQAALLLTGVQHHLDRTWFSWRGETGDRSVFYYRIHSPVILIEFGHRRGTIFDVDVPFRNHIHTIVRTPNGNDYGAELLRQWST